MKYNFKWHYIIKAPFWGIIQLITMVIWPYIRLFAAFIDRGKYYSAHGEDKIELLEKLEKSDQLQVRSHLLEVCIESSFQVVS